MNDSSLKPDDCPIPTPAPERRPAKRRRKLINRSLQLKLVGTFLATSALAFLLQALLLSSYVAEAAAKLPAGGELLVDLAPGILLRSLVYSGCILLPITVLVGINATFRIAGPAYRFEDYLKRIARGEAVGECKIREGDSLQSLCDAINEASRSLQRANGAGEGPSSQRAA